jgi:hypothetical protein
MLSAQESVAFVKLNYFDPVAQFGLLRILMQNRLSACRPDRSTVSGDGGQPMLAGEGCNT